MPNYDAFPTGHLATAMATVTVIADNYPEYHFIRPVGYGLMGLLGYSMLNNGVHWACDYPVGIALGYAFAKIAVRNGRTRVEDARRCGGPRHGLGAPAHAKPWYRQGQWGPIAMAPSPALRGRCGGKATYLGNKKAARFTEAGRLFVALLRTPI